MERFCATPIMSQGTEARSCLRVGKVRARWEVLTEIRTSDYILRITILPLRGIEPPCRTLALGTGLGCSPGG